MGTQSPLAGAGAGMTGVGSGGGPSMLPLHLQGQSAAAVALPPGTLGASTALATGADVAMSSAIGPPEDAGPMLGSPFLGGVGLSESLQGMLGGAEAGEEKTSARSAGDSPAGQIETKVLSLGAEQEDSSLGLFSFDALQ